VILFGLSMDYHGFVLSRIREARRAGASASDAIASGVERTAGVVTSAAVVMVGAFGIFATLSTIDMKQLGVGLATAVLLDATIVRGVLLPAALQLLSENAWIEARWLRRMPARPRPRQAGSDLAPVPRALALTTWGRPLGV
jgi:RND superfamily putative drug exporter